MKVRVQTMNSYEARIANTQLDESELERQTDLECEGHVTVDKACICWDSKSEHYRPYLFLAGRVDSISGNFLNNVTEVTFPTLRSKPRVNYRYDFSREELSDLCKKGLYEKGFDVPTIFTNNEDGFELPMKCDVCSIKNQNVPIMFVNINNPFLMDITAETCGYDLADYFEYQEVAKTGPVIEDTFLSDEKDVVKDDLFHMDEEITKTPEMPKELTEEERTLKRVLNQVEDYTVTKAEERSESLELKQKFVAPANPNDVDKIRKEIEQSGIDVALQKAKEDQDNGREVKPVVMNESGHVTYGDEKPFTESESEDVENSVETVEKKKTVPIRMNELAEESDAIDRENSDENSFI